MRSAFNQQPGLRTRYISPGETTTVKPAEISVGILSDTHGYIHPEVLQRVNECDVIVHAGDICGSWVLEQLEPADGQLIAVRGNNDVHSNWTEKGSFGLADLTETNQVELPGGTLSVIHGHQYWDLNDPQQAILAHFPKSRAVVYGHSHYIHHELVDGRWLLNPGAAGKRLNRGASSCLVLKASHKDWHVDLHRFENEG